MSIEDLRTRYRCDLCFDVSDGPPKEQSGYGRCKRHTRFAFLATFQARTEAEEKEAHEIAAEIMASGRELPWPILENNSAEYREWMRRMMELCTNKT